MRKNAKFLTALCFHLKGENSSNSLQKNNLLECSVVKMAEQNCSLNYENEEIVCGEEFCKLPETKKSPTDPSKLGFWFQSHFKLTKENINQVKNNIHLKRYICIKKDANGGIDMAELASLDKHLDQK